MKWILIISQELPGCDYTVGCGVKLFPFTAPTPEKAVDWCRLQLEDYFLGENPLESALLFLAGDALELPLGDWEMAKQVKIDAEKLEAKEESDRQIYEKLHRKFGNK